MKRAMKTTAVLALTLFATAACTRRVQVESEPNEPRYLQTTAAEIRIEGVYDYVAAFPDGSTTSGPMTIARAGESWSVDFRTEHGQVTTSNVRREGNTLRMETMTPGGPGTIELTWESSDAVVGEVFIGDVLSLRATRRS